MDLLLKAAASVDAALTRRKLPILVATAFALVLLMCSGSFKLWLFVVGILLLLKLIGRNRRTVERDAPVTPSSWRASSSAIPESPHPQSAEGERPPVATPTGDTSVSDGTGDARSSVTHRALHVADATTELRLEDDFLYVRCTSPEGSNCPQVNDKSNIRMARLLDPAAGCIQQMAPVLQIRIEGDPPVAGIHGEEGYTLEVALESESSEYTAKQIVERLQDLGVRTPPRERRAVRLHLRLDPLPAPTHASKVDIRDGKTRITFDGSVITARYIGRGKPGRAWADKSKHSFGLNECRIQSLRLTEPPANGTRLGTAAISIQYDITATSTRWFHPTLDIQDQRTHDETVRLLGLLSQRTGIPVTHEQYPDFHLELESEKRRASDAAVARVRANKDAARPNDQTPETPASWKQGLEAHFETQSCEMLMNELHAMSTRETQAEYEELSMRGRSFTGEPTKAPHYVQEAVWNVLRWRRKHGHCPVCSKWLGA